MAARKYSIPELLVLADRMIGRGTSHILKNQPQLQKDCLDCGMLLANLLLKGVIAEAIVLGRTEEGSPPIVRSPK
jgi:hypothetical protein